MQTAQAENKLIPPPAAVRVELARTVREARRLRSLLRIAVKAEEDRRFIQSQTGVIPRQGAVC